ncbi:IS4 family transposase [Candidatus Peregrinibacteria bacterium]|nr:IS4 family transposase [Candidatus Peregrinibacteria bacterium]
MYDGSYVFRQITGVLSRYDFEQCVDVYNGNRFVKSFPCWQQFLCLIFGQLTFRESTRSIVLCLNAHPKKLYHLGFATTIKLSTLYYANEQRDWRIYEAFAQMLIKRVRPLYQDDRSFLEGLDGAFYAFDSTTIDLCLAVFTWAHFREHKGAVKAHVLLALRGNLPVFIHITDGTVHDVNALDMLPIEPGACYIMDRGYIDFRRLYDIHEKGAFFITRMKRNTQYTRLYSRRVDRSQGLRCDQTIRLTGIKAQKDYPDLLRRVKFYDSETKNTYVFLTNNFILTAQQIADLYKQRWQIELFFKWIKGHLKITVFWGESENAVRTQIWVAVCTYLAVAILKKQWRIEQSMYDILQILSTSAFEKIGLQELFSKIDLQKPEPDPDFSALGLGF